MTKSDHKKEQGLLILGQACKYFEQTPGQVWRMVVAKPRCDSCGSIYDDAAEHVVIFIKSDDVEEYHQFCCLRCLRIWLNEKADKESNQFDNTHGDPK